MYDQLGFGRYWWFGKRDYLMDTYWPNSLAESGFLGAGLLLLFFLALLMHGVRFSLREASGPAKRYAIASVGGMAYMLLVSPTSPTFQDPRLFVLSAILFGIAASLASGSGHGRRP